MLLSNQPANTRPQQTPSPSPTQNFKSKLQQQIVSAAAVAAANIANGSSHHQHHQHHQHHHHSHSHSHHHHHNPLNNHHNHNHNQHNISFATDFSIAAIMARGGNAPSSREPSERSLSPASVERYSGQDADDDVDVDVVDCSDSEMPTATAAAAAAAASATAAAAAAALQAQQQARQALRVAQQQQQQQQQQQKQQTHHHATANKQQRQHHNHHSSNTNSNISNSNSNSNSNISNSGHSNSNSNSNSNCKSSSHRGRSAAAVGAAATPSPPPPPPSQSPEELERLSPEESPAQPTPKIVGSCNCDDLTPVQCHLETKELWDKFHELGTEMIITKSGRRMFPTVRVSFSGPLRQIQPADRYAVLLDVVPLDSRRYRYAYHRSSWLVAGKADPPPPARIYAHPDCPLSPEALRKQVVSFEKVKLTNNEMDKSGQVVLNSMHRYQPRIHLVRLSHGQSMPGNPKELQDMDHKTFVFPETVFTAVTAYQNQLITKLKIDSNPFAKGFRDSSRLSDFDRDPMDAFFFDQHMRTAPLRFFPDPLMSQLTPQEADAASLALLEKARQHLQMFGRSPYTEMLLPHLYQRSAAPPPPPHLSAFQLGMWQQQWPQLTAGFLASANQQAALALAAAGANRTPPPPVSVAPPAPATPTSSCGSASPDLRSRPQLSHYPQRFSPYQVPQHQASPPASNRAESP
ncbi:T-box protein H15 isoform X2 [Drosophila gunungcola]|uniref:T-box protein H15 isoform X2 n=1 Tax=Drosophila gunungcola TaxID=103775 RepID=UPI0022E076F5|nr:T-box protein H15 isoform X2 [Drosophila gunungcola]